MKEILLSIIVPVYNDEDVIERTLNSIVPYLTEEIELICIDDGSKDDSYNKLQTTLKKSKYKNVTIYKQSNEGSMHAREKGVGMASGSFIMFVDSGDELEKNVIKKVVKEIENDKNENDIFIINYITIEKNKITSTNISKSKVSDLKYMLLDQTPSSICLKICNRALLKNLEVYSYKDRIDNAEDLCVSIEVLSRSNKCKLIDDCYYLYNMEPNSMCTGIDSKVKKLNALTFIEMYIKNKNLNVYSEYLRLVYVSTILKIVSKPLDDYYDTLMEYYNKYDYKNNKYINQLSRLIIENLVKYKHLGPFIDKVTIHIYNVLAKTIGTEKKINNL